MYSSISVPTLRENRPLEKELIDSFVELTKIVKYNLNFLMNNQ